MVVKVVKKDGSNLGENEKLSMTNHFGHSLFEDITTRLNNVQVWSEIARMWKMF